MERLTTHNETPAGISGNMLRTFGLVFLACGLIGRGVLQNHLLGLTQLDAEALLELLNASQQNMILVTVSLVLQAMETCAAPIYALLLVNGVKHTGNIGKYMMRVAALALVTELPYSLAVKGSLTAPGLNPVFATLLALILLYLFTRFPGKSFKAVAVKVVLTLAGIVWGRMLSIEAGSAMVVLVASLWMLREKPLYRNFSAAVGCVLCTVFSPFFLAAPMGLLAVHFYNAEESDNSPWVNYLAYPALVVLTAAAGFVL